MYNGELYNTPELRAALQNKGHSFTGHSDTEVLLHAFAQWGAGCLERCNGIFAFSVWAQRAGTLFLARTAVGSSRCFTCRQGTVAVWQRDQDPAGPPGRAASGGRQRPGRSAAAWSRPHAGVRGVQKYPGAAAGQCAVYEADTGRLTLTRYWQLTDHDHPDDFETTARNVRDLVVDAIRGAGQ